MKIEWHEYLDVYDDCSTSMLICSLVLSEEQTFDDFHIAAAKSLPSGFYIVAQGKCTITNRILIIAKKESTII